MDTKWRVVIRAIVGATLAWLLLIGAVQAGMGVPTYELVSGIEDSSALDYSALPHSLTPLSPEYIARILGLEVPVGSGTTVAAAEVDTDSFLAAPVPDSTSIDNTGGERTVVAHEATNDDFADAYPIRSVPFTARTDSSDASRESGEPSDCAPTGTTLWYRFTPARAVGLVAGLRASNDAFTERSDEVASVAIFVGSALGDLQMIDCDADARGLASIAFPAEKGVDYFAQVTAVAGPSVDRGNARSPIVFSLDPLGVTERVSVSSTGEESFGYMTNSPMLSADGRFVTFQSEAENLVPGDDDGTAQLDVFVHDRVTETTELVSVDSRERQRDRDSGGFQSAISADGRYVAFHSEANLVPRDGNDYDDVFVRDRVRGTTTRVSVSSAGKGLTECGPECDPFVTDAGPGTTTRGVSITPDGRFVAFEYAMGLDERHPPGPDAQRAEAPTWGVYVHDRRTHTTELVSVNSRGESAWGNPYGSDFPVISANGRYVAFRSDATNLVCRRGRCDRDTTKTFDVFVHDRRTQKTELVSKDSDGSQQNGVSHIPAISANGRYVAFSSNSSNLVADSVGNGFVPSDTEDIDVFVHDRMKGKTELVSVNSAGEQQDQGGTNELECSFDQLKPAISANGRYVAFSSLATNLAANDDNEVRDVFLHDRRTRITTLVSVSSAGQPAPPGVGGGSTCPALSADARFVAFTSTFEFVAEEGAIQDQDVFVHSLPFL